jgi:hypothetical protein
MRRHTIVILGMLSICGALCCMQGERTELVQRETSCDLRFDRDKYMESLDSTTASVLSMFGDTSYLSSLKTDMHRWFDVNEISQFWTICDSLLAIDAVLCMCEVVSEDFPDYHCMALVQARDGYAVVATHDRYELLDTIAPPDIARLTPESAEDMLIKLKRWRDGLKVGCSNEFDATRLLDDFFAARACINGELVAFFTGSPSGEYDRAFDSLYSNLRELLGRTPIHKLELRK